VRNLQKIDRRPPASDEIEISLFGPGYGESVLVHVGGGRWLVVDSCQPRESAQPLALDYLHSMNVDVSVAVKTIVATHWHDDHVRGIATLFEAASQSEFVFSSSIDLAALPAATDTPVASKFSSGIDQLAKVAKLARNSDKGSRKLRPVSAGTRLLTPSGPVREVWALSPSAADVLLGLKQIAASLPSATSGPGVRRVASLQPNDTSVVLGVETDFGSILLGGDLEHRIAGRDRGWHAVMDLEAVPTTPARFFKIPHHGSQGADCPEVWEHRVEDENPVLLLAPFARGSVLLPTDSDLERIRRRSTNAFRTTARVIPLQRRDRTTTRTIREVRQYRSNQFEPGHIQVRVDSRGWRVNGSMQAQRL
jgi:beta-lactamase superfamily II metal-dependent hydrolase